jgi:uncharacterized protein YcbK (DUF882 family)
MRRRGVLAAALAALSISGPAHAGDEARSKKQVIVEGKAQARPAPAERERWRRELRKRVGRKPAGLVNIYNTWTHEFIAVEATAAEVKLAPELINRFLRCHFTSHEVTMDARLFGVLVRAARHFKVERVDIVSGFRAPKYNLMLRKKGRRVARKSEHTFGNAVDFRLPGVSTERLRTWARRMKMGGVGYYKDDAFVHVDTGPVRYWAE